MPCTHSIVYTMGKPRIQQLQHPFTAVARRFRVPGHGPAHEILSGQVEIETVVGVLVHHQLDGCPVIAPGHGATGLRADPFFPARRKYQYRYDKAGLHGAAPRAVRDVGTREVGLA